MPKAPNGFFAAGKVSFIPGITGGSAAAWILMKAAASTTKWLYSREIQEEKVDTPLKEQEDKLDADDKWSFSPDGQLGLLLRDEETTYYILWAGCLVFEYIGKDGVQHIKINRTLNDKYKNGNDNITENIRRLIFIQLLWTMAKQTVKEDYIKILNNKLTNNLTKNSRIIPLIQNLKNKLPDETHSEPNSGSYIKENILYFTINPDNKICDVILSKDGMDTNAKCPLGENWTPIGKLKCVKAN